MSQCHLWKRQMKKNTQWTDVRLFGIWTFRSRELPMRGTSVESIPPETEKYFCLLIRSRCPSVWWPACGRPPSWPVAVDVSPVRPPLLPGRQRCGLRFGWWTGGGPRWCTSCPCWHGPTPLAPPGKSRMVMVESRNLGDSDRNLWFFDPLVMCSCLPVSYVQVCFDGTWKCMLNSFWSINLQRTSTFHASNCPPHSVSKQQNCFVFYCFLNISSRGGAGEDIIR